MKPKILFKKIKHGPMTLERQREEARALLVKATGKNLQHSETGRPVVDQSMDVSISHKEDLVCVGIVPKPYRIGVDVERIDVGLNAELFFGSVITEIEQARLRAFCENNNLSLISGVVLFWSIKESFFKCLDYDLKPGKVNIVAIAPGGRVTIDCADEINQVMAERRLKLYSIRASLLDREFTYTEVLMKESD